MNVKSLRFAAILLAGMLVAVACSASSSPSPTTPGSSASPGAPTDPPPPTQVEEVTIALFDTDFTLTSMDWNYGYPGIELVKLQYDTLVTRDTDNNPQPLLATAWESNATATEWTFTLRDGVKWHDGTPFDAQSVVESAEYLVSIEAIQEIRNSAGFGENFVGAEALDDLTVQMTYNLSQPLFPIQMAYWRMEKAHENVDTEPIGTGPYRFVQWDRGSKVVLEANPDYWGDSPKVGTVEFTYIPDDAARVAALLAGEVDIIDGVIIEDQARVPKILSPSEPIQFYRLVIDSREGETADPRVRQAMNYALDKEAINEAFFGGLGIMDQCQSLLPSHIGYNDSLSPYPYDVERAKELMAEAGVESMEIVFMGAADRWVKEEEVMEVVANYWSEIGINTTLDIVPFQEWLDRAFVQPGPRPDVYFVGASIRTFDAQSLSGYLQSPDFPTARTSSVTDPEMDALIVAAEPIIDLEEREAAFQPVVERLCDMAYFGFLFAVPDFYATQEDISFNPDPRLRWTRVEDMTFD